MNNVNQSLLNPFAPLPADLYSMINQELVQLHAELAGAYVYYLSLSNQNRQKLIQLGSKKAEGYDTVNAERYDLDNRLEALKVKNNVVERLTYMRVAEMRHLDKGPLGI